MCVVASVSVLQPELPQALSEQRVVEAAEAQDPSFSLSFRGSPRICGWARWAWEVSLSLGPEEASPGWDMGFPVPSSPPPATAFRPSRPPADPALCLFSGAIGMNNRGAIGGTSVPAGPPPATGPGPMIPDGAMGMVMSAVGSVSRPG